MPIKDDFENFFQQTFISIYTFFKMWSVTHILWINSSNFDTWTHHVLETWLSCTFFFFHFAEGLIAFFSSSFFKISHWFLEKEKKWGKLSLFEDIESQNFVLNIGCWRLHFFEFSFLKFTFYYFLLVSSTELSFYASLK